MKVEYQLFESLPHHEVLDGVIQLHQIIFRTREDLISKMASKGPLVVMTAMADQKVIGYKIGYELNSKIFYSWLGGVDPNYRNLGIASTLMEKQHNYLKEKGYKIVRTKTMNRWRNMLLLNIKNGFNIIETYIDEKGQHKIILEKNL